MTAAEAIDRGDHQAVRLVPGHAAPVQPADVARHMQAAFQAGRREHAVVAQRPEARQACLALGRRRAPDVGLGHRLRDQAGRLRREGLRGRGVLLGHVARRHRPLDDGEVRLAGDPIEEEQVPGLRSDGDGGAATAGEEERLRGDVVVPDVVVDGLECPRDLAGRRLQRHDAVGVGVVAGAVAAEVVGAGAADRQDRRGRWPRRR